MPDSVGKLTPLEHTHLINWLREKWTQFPKCEMCGQSNWTVGDQVTASVNLADGHTYVWAGPNYPIVPVTCLNCGNSKFVNVIITKTIQPFRPPNA